MRTDFRWISKWQVLKAYPARSVLLIDLVLGEQSFRLCWQTLPNMFVLSINSFAVIPHWKKDYAVYYIDVQSAGLQWRISKRYSEFEQLHTDLVAAITRGLVPPLPMRTMFSNLDEKYLCARKTALSQFLNVCTSIPDIICSPIFMTFVGALETTRAELHRNHLPSRQLDIERACSLMRSGDVILIRSRGALSKLQRTVLVANYDHVAVVIRNPTTSTGSNGLFLLESTVFFPIRTVFICYYFFVGMIVD
jgi:hypothetical protein